MKRKTLDYDRVVTIENLMDVYKIVRNNTRHKEKILSLMNKSADGTIQISTHHFH